MRKARLPLEHVRIVDLTQAWAGSYASQLLADLGACILKIESRSRPDPWRGGFRASRGLPAYPLDGAGERPFNRSYLANSVNRNKYGLTLDLSTEAGKEAFLALVRDCDVVMENYTPRVLPNFGLHFERLEKERPGLILASMPAYGTSGPYSQFPGIGGTIEPMSGNAWLLGEEGGVAQVSGVMYPDAIAGMNGAMAVLTALQERHRSGRGGHVEVSQQEAMMTMIGEFVAAGYDRGPVGNADLWMIPNGIYPTADGMWIAISVRDDADWIRLKDVCPALNSTAPGGVASRSAHRNEVDGQVRKWTEAHSAAELEGALQAAGVPAARVRSISEAVRSPELAELDFFVEVEQPDVGRHRMSGMVPRLSETPGDVRMPAPRLGEHSRDILRNFLGYSDAYIDKLEADGVCGEPTPEDYS